MSRGVIRNSQFGDALHEDLEVRLALDLVLDRDDDGSDVVNVVGPGSDRL